MKNKLIQMFGIVFAVGILLLGGTVSAQSNTMHEKSLERILELSNRLTPNRRAFLSSGKRNLLHAAQVELNRTSSMRASVGSPPTNRLGATVLPAQASSATADGLIIVSNPKLDYAHSVLSGFRQSTSSSARCGNSVVVGFGDVEDAVEIQATAQGLNPAFSWDGVSISGDGGQTFEDLGHVGFTNVPANEVVALGGDPVVACTSANHFYYASLLDVVTFDQGGCQSGCPNEGVSVSISNNAGKTWADPVNAVLLSGFDHLVDRPWLAVDPTNPLRLYVTFTDFQAFNGFNPCVSGAIDIDLVNSRDGGKTWSAPAVVHEECPDANTGAGNLVTGSNVVVSPKGEVYVAYELFSLTQTSFPQILFQRSLDHAQTFSKPAKVSDVFPIGGGAFQRTLQGLIRADELPMLAVDRSTGASRGTVYVTWSDGRDNVRADLISGAYPYSDVFVAKSTDSGLSFTVLPPISPTPLGFRGTGRDQFLPGIAVDKDGEVAVCYYDRRNDPTNMAIDRYCSVSDNQGLSWQDLRASSPSWVPLNIDPLPFVSSSQVFFSPSQIFASVDYNTVTSDFLLTNDGFFGAFELQVDGNPNIVGKKF